MPELISEGPNIPISLMNKLDDEKVVFFCGAGISQEPGSDLPNYDNLLREVYIRGGRENNIDDLEKEMLGIDDKSIKDLGKKWSCPNTDQVFNLLERDSRLGKEKLRNHVMKILEKEPSDHVECVMHKALLELSNTSNGIRLVTTNFDNRFIDANAKQRPVVDIAPKLPIPKNTWSSLVHLSWSYSYK